MNTPTAPGVFRDVPDEVYHSWDLPSNSRFTDLDHAPEACAHAMREEKKSTAGMRVGRYVHLAVLQPELVAEQFVEPSPCSGWVAKKGDPCVGVVAKTGQVCGGKTTMAYLDPKDPKWLCKKHAGDMGEPLDLKRGHECGAASALPYGAEDAPTWRCGNHNKGLGDPLDIPTLTPAQRDEMGRKRTSVLRYPAASRLLDLCEERELTIVFVFEGMLCKARIDAYSSKYGGILADLKGCPDATARAFAGKAVGMSYFRQLSFYREALLSLGMPVAICNIIAVDSSEACITRVYSAYQKHLDLAMLDLKRLAALYRRHVETGVWIGAGGKAQSLGLPAWAEKRLESAASAG